MSRQAGAGRVRAAAVRQTLAALVFSQTHLAAGAALGFNSVFVSQQRALTGGQVSWVLSGLALGLVAGNLVSTFLSPLLGYRRLVLTAVPLHIASCLLLALSHQFPLMLAARVVGGLAVGATDGPARAYISETASSRLRGPLGMLPNLLMSVNTLAVFGVASRLGWRYAVLICGVPPAVLLLPGALLLPESGTWLLAHGRDPELARRALLFYRGLPELTEKELELAQSTVATESPTTSTPVLRRVRSVFTQRTNRRPFLLMLFQLLLFVYNPGEAITNFTTVIFSEAGGQRSAYYSAIYVGLARLAGNLLSAWLIERAGRVRLLLAAAAGQLLASVAVGCYFYYQQQLQQHSWLVLLACLVTYFCYGVGITPVTWVYFSELSSSAVRSVSVNMLLVWFGTLMFSFVHVYRLAESTVGPHGVFWTLAGVSAIQMVFAHFCLPETRGLSLEEIQVRFFAKPEQRKDEDHVRSIGINNTASGTDQRRINVILLTNDKVTLDKATE